jgi:hypothetical protein
MRHLILSRAAAISLIGLVAAGCEHTRSLAPPPPASAGITISVRDYPADRQQRLAAEIEAAPADAVWPEMISDYSQLRRGACSITPNQPACRRICAAGGNRYGFCRRAKGQ